MVSLASAVAMAITMVQKILVANNGTLPMNVDLFTPLYDSVVRVPVTPEVEFHFARKGDNYYDWYDFYFFQVSSLLILLSF